MAPPPHSAICRLYCIHLPCYPSLMYNVEPIIRHVEDLSAFFDVPFDVLVDALNDIRNNRPRKRRGAPFGNQNARKHGLYSKYLSPDRIKKLDQVVQIKDLSHEIAIIRFRLDALLSDPEASNDEIFRMGSLLNKFISTQRRHFPHDSHTNPPDDEREFSPILFGNNSNAELPPSQA